MPDTREQFDLVLQLLEREDRLINSRMTWYLTVQGFIIAGVALAFSGKFECQPHVRKPAIISLSLLGAAISLVVFVSVRRARKAKMKVNGIWENVPAAEAASFPDPRGDTSRLSILTPGQSVPWILIVFWLVVIVGALI